jgi:hypothetical protein
MSETTPRTVPAGYWEDGNGALIPADKVKPVDKARDKAVRKLIKAARDLEVTLGQFKLLAMGEVEDFVTASAAEHGVTWGGKKGNISLTSFDARFKVERAMQDQLMFDERLQVAKQIIDELVHVWSKGANKNIQVLVQQAFQVDKAGNISTSRVLGLRSLKIEDEQWQKAMNLISDACKAVSTTAYIRFYERDENGKYQPIALSLAAV